MMLSLSLGILKWGGGVNEYIKSYKAPISLYDYLFGFLF